MVDKGFHITGTLLWYYGICHREVWLMAHSISPDEDYQLLDIGRFLDENTIVRQTKSVRIGDVVFDRIRSHEKDLVVGEVKKSSRFLESSRLQLGFYLKTLEDKGVKAVGELRFPTEKKIVRVFLDEKLRSDLEEAVKEISNIAIKDLPPPALRCKFCKNCAYAEFCWA